MVKIEKVNKYFNKGKRNQIHVIDNTSLELPEKGLVALLGPSGSGKTTLLNVIGGLDKVNKGKVYINGKRITKKRAGTVDKIRNLNVGYIFQDYKLIDNMTVFDNIAISLKMIGIKNKEEIKKRVNYVLEKVDMYRYRHRFAGMLSGGERQRIGIARAIVKNPNIIIADEPTGNLDSKNSIEIMNIIKAISKNKLVILVTHEVELAKFYASRIIELKDGKIVADYLNNDAEDLDYRIENKFYLKDFKNHEKIDGKDASVEVYTNSKEPINVKLIVKNGNIYIKSENNEKIEVIDSNSNIELVDDKYKKMDKSVYQKYEFNLEEIASKNKKEKYSSIFNLFTFISNGFKKVLNYTILKKILLIGYIVSAMFIVLSISNTIGTLKIEDEKFVTTNKNYLNMEMPNLSVEDYLKYEQEEGIKYILPGDSKISFNVEFDDYYQTANVTEAINGSLSDINMISETDIVYGRMPENEKEIVIDKMCIKKKMNELKMCGVLEESQVLGRKASLKDMDDFVIVGITDLENPAIYMSSSMFVNAIANTNEVREDSGLLAFAMNMMGMASYDTTAETTFLDYNLKKDSITLKKGKWPENDYEVIVNVSHKYEMPLNKTISNKVNDIKLKVVGYYDSAENLDKMLVNTNTVKYNAVVSAKEFTILAENKEDTINRFREEYSIDLKDAYKRDKASYMKMAKDLIKSKIISAIVVFVISLIEIYLMIRASFLSRIKEIGTYRAIGVKKKDIYLMFLGEILAITSTASVLGVAIMAYILKVLSGISYIADYYIINVKVILCALAIIYVFNIIVGLLPVHHVIRKTPAQILSRHDI